MSTPGVDPLLLHAWLSARSVARGLPRPVAEYGGFRIDTNSDAEVRRWVFPRTGSGLAALAKSITKPRRFLKLCGEAGELRAAIPPGWELHPPSYFMQGSGRHPSRPLPDGYTIAVDLIGPVIEARIVSDTGMLAASGYAAETSEVLIYDRIVTAPEHRRKGLGNAVMAALQRATKLPCPTELLVATEAGHALYTSLGWRTISPYSTASIGVS